MTRIARDPITGTTRLLVDGTNLLHQLAAGPDRQPPAALIGRLRGAIPPEVSIELVFDGPAERGLRGERIAHGVSVRYGGRHTADTILVTLVEEATMDRGAHAADSILVVTDDRAPRFAIQNRGARTAGASWLVARMSRSTLSSPSVGNARPPRLAQTAQATQAGVDDTRPWSPGRGATTKKGNGKRAPKR